MLSPTIVVDRDRSAAVLLSRSACPEYVEGISSAYGRTYLFDRTGAVADPDRQQLIRRAWRLAVGEK
jgi:hypothetical protein